MTRRIIDELELVAIAAVDNPCQQPALARVIKRRPDEPVERVPIAKAAPADPPAGNIEAEIAKLMERDGCGRADAMEKLAREQPALVAASRSAPVEKVRPAFELGEGFGTVRKAAQARFSLLVDDLARSGMAKAAAMERARVMHPAEFAAAYS